MNPWLEKREVEPVAAVRCDKNGTSTTAQGALSTKVRNSLLTVLAFTVLLTPRCALAAEREGTVLFFSFAGSAIQGMLYRGPAATKLC